MSLEDANGIPIDGAVVDVLCSTGLMVAVVDFVDCPFLMPVAYLLMAQLLMAFALLGSMVFGQELVAVPSLVQLLLAFAVSDFVDCPLRMLVAR